VGSVCLLVGAAAYHGVEIVNETDSQTFIDQNIDCEEIMTALDECHARGFLYKAIGGCNDIKREVNRCLSGERTKNSSKNRESALERRKRIEAIWEKMDEGDYSALEAFTKRK